MLPGFALPADVRTGGRVAEFCAVSCCFVALVVLHSAALCCVALRCVLLCCVVLWGGVLCDVVVLLLRCMVVCGGVLYCVALCSVVRLLLCGLSSCELFLMGRVGYLFSVCLGARWLVGFCFPFDLLSRPPLSPVLSLCLSVPPPASCLPACLPASVPLPSVSQPPIWLSLQLLSP